MIKKKLKILAVIPARYNSSRLPGKPLALIGNKPMIQRVYEKAATFSGFDKLVVATDDRRIFETVINFGGEVEMTNSDHFTGTDRVAEVAGSNPGFEVVVNIQGDLPFLDNDFFQKIIEPYLTGADPDVVTMAAPLAPGELANPNVVKLICNDQDQVLNFTRVADKTNHNHIYNHVGLYAYRADFLKKFITLVPRALEKKEKAEMLRVLEYGHSLKIVHTDRPVCSVDTADDLALANKMAAELTALPKTVRIIFCRSAHSLIAAIAAVKHVESKNNKNLIYQNYLVINSVDHWLEDSPRTEKLVGLIIDLANRLLAWDKIIYLNNKTFYNAVCRATKANVENDLIQLIYQEIGVKDAHEIYLLRNRDFLESRVMIAYPKAKKICYGDSFGVYYDHDVATDQLYRQSLLISLSNFKLILAGRQILGWLTTHAKDRARLKMRRSQFPILNQLNMKFNERQPFDFGCYIFSKGLGFNLELAFDTQEIANDIVLRVLEQASGVIDSKEIELIYEKMGVRPLTIFLTSVFWAKKEIAKEKELLACVNFLKKSTEPGSLILVKTHPSLGSVSLNEFKKCFRFEDHEVIFLDEMKFFLVPLEIFLQALFLQKKPTQNLKLNILTLSTSTLGVAKIFGIDSKVGFGGKLVFKYFKKLNIIPRLVREYLIKKGLREILTRS